MAILVDQARWPWRGRLWCHLVSDRSFDELHEFAAPLGCRRLGFQGDHYDIDTETREVAIAAGALEVDSRVLVRRIREAGLRRRPSDKRSWNLVERVEGPVSVMRRLEADHRLDGDGVEACRSRLEDVIGALHLRRDEGVGELGPVDAFLIHATGEPLRLADAPSRGRHVRSSDGADGRLWSIELTSRPLADAE